MGPPFLALWRCRGGWLPPGGIVPCGDAPPIFFSILRKRKRAVHGPKEKGAGARSGAVALRADGGRRIGASAGFACSSGTL